MQLDAGEGLRFGGEGEQSIDDGQRLALPLKADQRLDGPRTRRKPERMAVRRQRKRLPRQFGCLFGHRDHALVSRLLQSDDRLLVVQRGARAIVGRCDQSWPSFADDVPGTGTVQRPTVARGDVCVRRFAQQIVREEHCAGSAAEQSVVDGFTG